MIYISDKAKEKLFQLLREEGMSPEEYYVRISVKHGGCAGLSYDLSFDKELGNDDKLFEKKGINIIVNKTHFSYLVGTKLEYDGGLKGKGFYFENPNATRTCSCGESFSNCY